MISNDSTYLGTCVQCKKSASGKTYHFIRKDCVGNEEDTGFRGFPGQHRYRLTYRISHHSSFVCQSCVRRSCSFCIVRLILCLAGLGFGIFLIFQPFLPKFRFLGIIFVLFVAGPQTFASLLLVLQGTYGGKVAMKVARYELGAKGESHSILFQESDSHLKDY